MQSHQIASRRGIRTITTGIATTAALLTSPASSSPPPRRLTPAPHSDHEGQGNNGGNEQHSRH
jgi:hypothetical protein